MFEPTQMIVVVAVLLGLVLSGVHIAIALGVTACIGIYMMQPDIHVVTSFVSNTAYEAVRDYVFAVIPLFMLMGEFLAKCGAARDLFALVNRRPSGCRVASASPRSSQTPSSDSSPASASRPPPLSRESPGPR